MASDEQKHCNHFVTRKKRYCRISPLPGQEYCPEHQPPTAPNSLDSDENGKIRIVCPLDRKHTCYAHNLKKHLKICNARPKVEPPYIQKSVNCGAEDADNSSYKLLSEFSVQQVIQTISKVVKVFDDVLADKITDQFSTHKVVEDEMLKPEYGNKTKKHLKQASAILGLLQDYTLIKGKTCYVEFGAGRGQLSYWLAKATEMCTDCSYLLVERSSPKHKQDNKLDKSEDKVQRIRADIADLVLDKVDAVAKTCSVVGVTKHLCGDATDLALRCMANLSYRDNKLTGCLMTFCCHHRCRWRTYTGKGFFKENGLDADDFNMMCSMSSWATCGTGYSRERLSAGLTDEDKLCQSDRDKEIGLNRSEKEVVGKKCKSILNWGRLKYLEDIGLKSALHYYVSPDVSLENVCVVAFKEQINN